MCNETFIKGHDLKAPWRSCIYQCTQCLQSFEHQENLEKHLQNAREEAAQLEEVNTFTPSFEEEMETSQPHNTSNVGRNQRYSFRARTCRLCHKTFNSIALMRTHLNSKHAQLPYQCLCCGENFKRKINLKAHRKERHPTPSLQPKESVKARTCRLCHNTFDSTFFMRKHLKSQHGQLPYQCLGCGGNFIKNSHLREHKKKCFQRPQQDLMESNEGVDPNQHQRDVDPADSSSSLATRESETEIPQSHSSLNLINSDTSPTQKPYLCEICGKDFLMLFRMKEHMRAHTGERPFPCRDCGKGFSRRRSLKRHRLIHTEGRPFLCTDCGKRFSTEASLKSHRLIHTGERPFACTLCKLRYLTKKHLQRHMKKHCFKTKHFNGVYDVQKLFFTVSSQLSPAVVCTFSYLSNPA
ncbi:unnamed protein product [Oncorhynchus mykiss]|uniref:C2H2-type domain-containing protein n=1 Tax=Oncorhynchus mykiss TaxID=8022 RepID=A0A060W921_ONCMY|nr:unnamed protein product [Oncorhynchus mykiss]